MMWQMCTLKKKVQRTVSSTPVVDELGNKVYDWVTELQTQARYTPWTDEQIALEGREVTKNEQRFALPVPFSSLANAERVVIGTTTYDITQKIDLSPRYAVIQCKVYKE